MPYSTYIEEFRLWLQEENKDPKTIQAYLTAVRQFITWYGRRTGRLYILQIQPLDIKDYLNYQENHLLRSPNTINKSIAALRTYFIFLSNAGYIVDNPMIRIKSRQINYDCQCKGINKWLTKKEQQQFIHTLATEPNDFERVRNLAIIDLMLYSGLRVSEVVNLKLEDVDGSDHLQITVGRKGNKSAQTVFLLEKHNHNLLQWLKLRQQLSKLEHLNSPHLFVSARNGQLSARGIQVMVDKYARLAGIRQLNCQRFRHSYCKNLADTGASINTIAGLARHANLNSTRIYLNDSQLEMIQALEKI